MTQDHNSDMLAQKSAVSFESTEEWTLKDTSGKEYLVQIGYPRDWFHPDPDAPTIKEPVPILYLSDGNSVFLSALEALHRRLAIRELFMTTGVVVAIGYPTPAGLPYLWSGRRNYDLTPKTPGCEATEGGADEFLDFIATRVRTHVHQRLKDTRSASPGREALYGHSFGALFTLHALFKRPELFDCYIASSPSIWYRNECILQAEEAFRNRERDFSGKKPSLMLFIGGMEENPPRNRKESDAEYEVKRKQFAERKMIVNVQGMHKRLSESGLLQHVTAKVYEEEDHATIIGCTVSRGVATFFDDWPYALRG